MACRCSTTLSHRRVTTSKLRSSLLPAARRVPFSLSSPYRSTTTTTTLLLLKRRAGQHGTTVALPLGCAVQCLSSFSPSRPSSSATREIASTGRSCIELSHEAESTSEGQPGRRIIPCLKLLLKGFVLAIALSYGFNAKAALAVAENSIAASNLGIKVATFLRGFGWPDELVVLTVAMLPVLELRGAIPISYWLKVDPIKGYILAVVGNMIPVPLILLYLKKLSSFLGERSGSSVKSFFTWLSERTRKKGGVIEEFEWLGLMLFVAVPFPGTGAWTGAFIAAILGIPFWEALTANFFGVVLAGLLVNLVVTLGARYALVVGLVLFVISTFMWNVLRLVQKRNKDAVQS